MSRTSPLAVSIGEPAGIGPDIVLRTWSDHRAETRSVPPFVLLCDPENLRQRAKLLELDIPVAVCVDSDEFGDACTPENFKETLPVLPLNSKLSAQPSKPNSDDANGIVEAITRGVELVRKRQASGLVTLPINKKSLYDSGFDYPGHTEFLAALAERWPGVEEHVRPVMMLAGPELRTVPVTIHIPLKNVPAALTEDLIVETGRITAHDLQSRFGIASPRLAFSGLNPHAGENGALGHEDAAIVAPAVDRLCSEGIDCRGPLPADTMFHKAARDGYDVALCMYHDQALIPAKALGFDDAVNATLGLPFVRTSPDHGTAFDIAGTGRANPSSFIAALNMAAEMAANSQ